MCLWWAVVICPVALLLDGDVVRQVAKSFPVHAARRFAYAWALTSRKGSSLRPIDDFPHANLALKHLVARSINRFSMTQYQSSVQPELFLLVRSPKAIQNMTLPLMHDACSPNSRLSFKNRRKDLYLIINKTIYVTR